ncbi:bis(5'-nucleosyl)-tetraphosphatase [asymmetrical] [Coccinella septempunctata]|uniref:bis(5'-nucleosyl)-tetraphosphatase [asymmetrical] n=1 Tax=Coccinella septempunctata TaxID=41139 RepID=UPI001D062177|nr:bis(5'-nucleosyl)-tetraphosphatase [asymmetrical] [Coccinella septempunctata]
MAKVAAGFIIFRRFTGVIEFLLLQSSNGEHHWTPPKGHTDPGETDLQAAYRETNEEAGLVKSDFKVFENEKFTLNYDVKGKPKTVHYWLAELTDNNACIKLSNEHQDYKWLPVQEACNQAKYKDMVDLLNKCQMIINEKYA